MEHLYMYVIVQYGKQIITGMTNFSNSDFRKGQSEQFYCIFFSHQTIQWLAYLLFCIAIKIINSETLKVFNNDAFPKWRTGIFGFSFYLIYPVTYTKTHLQNS